MADEADGVDEAFEGQIRMLVTIAARVAERIARARAQALRNSAGGDEHEARQLRARIAAQRAAAQADLAKVHQSSWWDAASLPQVAEAYQVASTWAGEGEFFDTAKTTIERELETRHGIGPAELPQPEQVAAAVDGPTFTMWENRPDAAQPLSKPEALALIEQMLPEQVANVGDPNSAVASVARWAGRDDDLDRAIAAKFPSVFPKGQPPTFDRTDANGATVELTKPAALATIERLPAAAIERVDEPASLMSEVAAWKGADKDIDAALGQKFPSLFEQAATETPETAAAAQSETAHPQESAAPTVDAPAVRFTRREYVNDSDVSIPVSKDDVLRDIQAPTTTADNVRYESWNGRDAEVDAVLYDRFPAEFPEASPDARAARAATDPSYAATMPAGDTAAQDQRSAAARERAEAEALIASADRADAAEGAAAADEQREPDRAKSAPEREAAAVEWDSSERRDALAAQLDHSGIPADAAEARKSADLAQGLPAHTAVTSKSKQTAAKRGQGTDPSKQRARGR